MYTVYGREVLDLPGYCCFLKGHHTGNTVHEQSEVLSGIWRHPVLKHYLKENCVRRCQDDRRQNTQVCGVRRRSSACGVAVRLCDYQTAAQGGRRYGKCCVGRKEHSLARITPGMTSMWCMIQCS
jgi:hypothetical protein